MLFDLLVDPLEFIYIVEGVSYLPHFTARDKEARMAF